MGLLTEMQQQVVSLLDRVDTQLQAQFDRESGAVMDQQQVISSTKIPHELDRGDLTLECFQLARELKQTPQQIAEQIVAVLPDQYDQIRKIEAAGPYVNFFFRLDRLAAQTIDQIQQQGAVYGRRGPTDHRVVIESPGPNTNKPLHLGHVRNMLLGNALAAIREAVGDEVIKVDIVNDRGVHICKSMLAYQQRGEGQEPDKKSDHFVGDRYVRYALEADNDPSLEQQIQVMLQQREEDDPEIRSLRQQMNQRALTGQAATYERYGTQIAKAYYESDHYLLGKEIVVKGLQDGLFTKQPNGNIVYQRGQSGDDVKVVLRADGTSIYITQDIALGKIRYDDWQMDEMIYVVANEQNHHFQVLFEIFQALDYPFAERCYHLGYGMISLPDGKMKSREGNVIDADMLADEMQRRAVVMLEERYPDLDQSELSRRAEQIGMGAIKFFVLKYDALKDFVFDIQQSLSFEGESGPYVQYTHARCCSILRKRNDLDQEFDAQVDYSLLVEPIERVLLVFLSQYGDLLVDAAERHQPYLVARYVLELAQLLNKYYQQATAVDLDQLPRSAARCALIDAVRQVMANGLFLLGIAAPERM